MEISRRAIVGTILGTAVGDALGLPYEGLSRRRGGRLWRDRQRYHLLPGRGMVSDDTEHACMVLQALIVSGDDSDRFARRLAKQFRLWLLGLPAGTGKATLLSCLKLCAGVSPTRSGVYSAGNGPAMRSPVLGAAIENWDLLKQFVRASSRITHTDPKAEYGALAIALATRMASGGSIVEGKQFSQQLREFLCAEPAADELFALVDQVVTSVERGESTQAFANLLGLRKGVSGYVYHTVPVVLHAWLKHQHDYRTAVVETIGCGGDTDSTAAIVGGIVGSAVGRAGIPEEWLDGLWEWPRTVAWMEHLGELVYEVQATGHSARPPRLPAYGLLPRNFFFLAVVLTHGLRRLLPPY